MSNNHTILPVFIRLWIEYTQAQKNCPMTNDRRQLPKRKQRSVSYDLVSKARAGAFWLPKAFVSRRFHFKFGWISDNSQSYKPNLQLKQFLTWAMNACGIRSSRSPYQFVWFYSWIFRYHIAPVGSKGLVWNISWTIYCIVNSDELQCQLPSTNAHVHRGWKSASDFKQIVLWVLTYSWNSDTRQLREAESRHAHSTPKNSGLFLKKPNWLRMFHIRYGANSD